MSEKNFSIYEEILHDISGGVLYLQGGKIFYVNPAALEILCKNKSELLGKTFVDSFFEYEENDDFNQMLLEVIYDNSIKHEKIVQYFTGKEIKHLHIKTSWIKSEKSSFVMLIDDVTELMNLRGIALDLEKIKSINEQLKLKNRQVSQSRDLYKKDAEIDKLTGLLNKIDFESVCKDYINHLSEDETAAFFVIDLDYFKEVNDTFGHQFGDLVLKRFAVELQNEFSSCGFVGRFGGDEYVVLLKNIENKNFVIDKAKSIVKMTRNLKFPNKEVYLSASIGIAIFSGEEKSYSEIFSAADESVYIVKTQGKNGFSINSSERKSV